MRTMVTKFRDLKQNQITSNIEINIKIKVKNNIKTKALMLNVHWGHLKRT